LWSKVKDYVKKVPHIFSIADIVSELLLDKKKRKNFVKPQLGPSKSSVSLVASKLGLPFKNKALEKGTPKISNSKTTSSASGTPRTEERVLHKIMKTPTGTLTAIMMFFTKIT
jgi:hypothetical protein